MELGGGFCTVNARSPFDDVEVNLNHAALGPQRIHVEGKRDLEELPDHEAAIPEKEVLGGLHGNGAGASDGRLIIIKGVFQDILHFNPVHAIMRAEAGILRGDYCSWQVARHLIKADPILVDAVALQQAEQHHIGNRRRHDGVNEGQNPGQDAKDNESLDGTPGPGAEAIEALSEVEEHRVEIWRLAGMTAFNTGISDLAAASETAFTRALAETARAVEGKLDWLLPDVPGNRLRSAMRYAALGGGKRLRPFLAVQSAALFDVAPGKALRVGAAIECLHCYSLVHDDLPAMDDDDLRRGRPTVHRAFDEATAILAGDGLQALAFEVVADVQTHDDPAIRSTLVLELAKAAGETGMVGGQMLDLLAEEKPFANYAEVAAMQGKKTGALIRFSCEAGAILGGADRSALAKYGETIGLAFQIADDVLDVESDAAELGKATQKDKGKGKATFVDLLGLDGAKREAARLTDNAVGVLAGYGERAELLRDAARYIISRRS